LQVSALGQLLSGEPHGPFRNLILQYLFGLAPIKEIDLHLSVGEALALVGATVPPAASASASPASTLPSLPPVVPPRKAGVDTGVSSGTAAAKAARAAAEATAEANDGGRLMPYILRKVLDEYLVAWAPLVRQAAAAWLYSVLQYKGECMLMATDGH
jgi:hypothetical protein